MEGRHRMLGKVSLPQKSRLLYIYHVFFFPSPPPTRHRFWRGQGVNLGFNRPVCHFQDTMTDPRYVIEVGARCPAFTPQ